MLPVPVSILTSVDAILVRVKVNILSIFRLLRPTPDKNITCKILPSARKVKDQGFYFRIISNKID